LPEIYGRLVIGFDGSFVDARHVHEVAPVDDALVQLHKHVAVALLEHRNFVHQSLDLDVPALNQKLLLLRSRPVLLERRCLLAKLLLCICQSRFQRLVFLLTRLFTRLEFCFCRSLFD